MIFKKHKISFMGFNKKEQTPQPQTNFMQLIIMLHRTKNNQIRLQDNSNKNLMPLTKEENKD